MPFIGEIRPLPYLFAPEFVYVDDDLYAGWLPCDGRTLLVRAFPLLYVTLGNRFGGNSGSFHLPDLRRHLVAGTGFDGGSMNTIGTSVGVEEVTIRQETMRYHTHDVNAFYVSNVSDLTAVPGVSSGKSRTAYQKDFGAPVGGTPQLHPQTISPEGSPEGQLKPHTNIQPVLGMMYFICCSGAFRGE